MYFDIDTTVVAQSEVTPFPPWATRATTVNLTVGQLKKVYQRQFDIIRDDLDDYHCIYTDGSKDGRRVACGVFLPRLYSAGARLPDDCSVYTAELSAIVLALQIIERSPYRQFIICSDSMSSLQALENKIFDHPLVSTILVKVIDLSRTYDIIFCWTPGHVGIAGNEKADAIARGALDQQITESFIPYTDFKPVINAYVNSLWQDMWDDCVNNKLHSIKPVLSARLHTCVLSRRDQAVLARCRIGHSRLTHRHLLVNEPAPECVSCQCPLTVKHILLECIDFTHVRGIYFQAGSLQDLFTNTHSSLIINFLKRIGLYFDI